MNKRYFIVALTAFALALAALPAAAQNPGAYSSALRPGMNSGVQLGRASTARQGVNSGNPKIFHGQSWNGSALGAQWEIKCGVETTVTPPDYTLYNAGTGTGIITYNQTFNGGVFTLYSDPSMPQNWVSTPSVSGTINVTSVIAQVQMVNFLPVASSFTASTSGQFENGCTMTFAMANGFGVGETPYASKPATYPAFLAADCSPADALHQFGTWGDVNDIIVHINADCATPTRTTTWGQVKSFYR